MTRLLAAGLALAATAVLMGQSRPLQPLLVVRLSDGGRPVPAVAREAGSQAQETARPSQLPPLPVARLDPTGANATLDAVRPLSLRFAQPMAVRDVLLLLVRDTGLSLVTEPGVEGTFVGELSGVTLRQALDLVLRPHGFDYSVEGGAIRVYRRRTETRIFDINVSAVRRRGSGSLSTSSSLRGNPESGSRAGVEWAADADAFEEISRAIQSLLSPQGRFAVDRRAGVVQVTDYDDRIDRVSVYLESVERRLVRQVDIEARVVEVTFFSDPPAGGVDWPSAIAKAQTTSASGTVTLDFAAFVRALGEQGRVSVLASPRVKALHNEPAVMRVGLQDVTFEREGPDGRQEHATAVLDGFSLAVVPHISADGMVTMSVAPSVVQRTGDVRERDRQKAPVTAVSEVSTSVRIRDGETLVLPGLRRERERQEPSGRGLAGLFRRAPSQRAHSELAVLLTPKVL